MSTDAQVDRHRPELERGGKAIRLHVALAPHEHCELVLTPLAFASAEGFPLETYAVDFATK